MLKFGETKVAKEELYGAEKPIKIWDVDANNKVISKSVEIKNNSKYLIRYLDRVIRPIVLILSKVSGYVKTFKVKDGDKDKSNTLIFFCIDDDKLLEKYKIIWPKIDDLKNIELNVLPVYDDRYIKNKIKTYRYKVYINFTI